MRDEFNERIVAAGIELVDYKALLEKYMVLVKEMTNGSDFGNLREWAINQSAFTNSEETELMRIHNILKQSGKQTRFKMLDLLANKPIKIYSQITGKWRKGILNTHNLSMHIQNDPDYQKIELIIN